MLCLSQHILPWAASKVSLEVPVDTKVQWAGLLAGMSYKEYISPVLTDLIWQQIHFWTQFKVLYKILKDLGFNDYLKHHLLPYETTH